MLAILCVIDFGKMFEQSGAKHVPNVPHVPSTNIVPGQHRSSVGATKQSWEC